MPESLTTNFICESARDGWISKRIETVAAACYSAVGQSNGAVSLSSLAAEDGTLLSVVTLRRWYTVSSSSRRSRYPIVVLAVMKIMRVQYGSCTYTVTGL